MVHFVYLVSVASVWLSIKWKTRWRWRLRDLHQSGWNIDRIRWNWYAFPPTQLHLILHYVTTYLIMKEHVFNISIV